MDRLVHAIIEESFGPISASVATHLLGHAESSLAELGDSLGHSPDELRNSLIVLIQHNIVFFNERDLFSVDDSNVLARLRFPKYLKILQSRFSELELFEELLENGSMTLKNLGEFSRMRSRNIQEFLDTGYLIPAKTFRVSEQNQEDNRLIKIPPKRSGSNMKNQLLNLQTNYYKLNFQMLDLMVLAQIIGKTVSLRLGNEAGTLAELMFREKDKVWNIDELHKKCPSDDVIDKMLQNEIIIKTTSTSFFLNTSYITRQVKNVTIERILRNRFQDYYARIYKCVSNKGILDEKSLSELTLLPLSETRACLNDLFVNKFIETISLANGLFYTINEGNIVYSLIEQFAQGIYNLKVRHKSEIEEIWGLYQKSWLSTDEKNALKQLKHRQKLNEFSILEMDSTLLILLHF